MPVVKPRSHAELPWPHRLVSSSLSSHNDQPSCFFAQKPTGVLVPQVHSWLAFKVSTHPTNRNTVAIKRDVMFLRFHDSADEFFHCYILFLVNFLLSRWFAMLALKYNVNRQSGLLQSNK